MKKLLLFAFILIATIAYSAIVDDFLPNTIVAQNEAPERPDTPHETSEGRVPPGPHEPGNESIER